ncbi:MAG: hypothetical protein JXM70_04925 [Pirellulales bacterium]|nr:hypothetical protein [Pirellulales bacterium]
MKLQKTSAQPGKGTFIFHAWKRAVKLLRDTLLIATVYSSSQASQYYLAIVLNGYQTMIYHS